MLIPPTPSTLIGVAEQSLLYYGDPQGVEPSCMRLYIGHRHFVPRPMPMERASLSSDLFDRSLPRPMAEDPGKRRRIQGIRPRQGVAHTSQSTSATPYGVAGSLAMPDPRVVGATPLDPGLKSGHPCRGASFTTLYNQLNGFCTTQMRQPCTSACGIEGT